MIRCSKTQRRFDQNMKVAETRVINTKETTVRDAGAGVEPSKSMTLITI